MEQGKRVVRWMTEHPGVWKAAAAVLILTVAAVFFGGYGRESEDSDILLTEPDAATASETAAAEEAGTEPQTTQPDADDTATHELYVDVGGAVRTPGVYTVTENARLFAAIEKAGGLTEDADVTRINQAMPLTDGQKIYIPRQGEAMDDGSGVDAGGVASGGDTGGKVDLNQADSAALQQLTGVGPVLAERILAYRQEHGPFRSTEELRNVSGIGAKTYEKLRDQITV